MSSTKQKLERRAVERLLGTSPFMRRICAGGGGSRDEIEDLLLSGSAEQISAVATRVKRTTFLIALGVILFIVFAFQAIDDMAESMPPPTPDVVSPAGEVVSVQLHESAFSTATSVQTTKSIYQVSGAVSAAAGDAVELVTGKVKQELCVTADIGRRCYRVR